MMQLDKLLSKYETKINVVLDAKNVFFNRERK